MTLVLKLFILKWKSIGSRSVLGGIEPKMNFRLLFSNQLVLGFFSRKKKRGKIEEISKFSDKYERHMD